LQECKTINALPGEMPAPNTVDCGSAWFYVEIDDGWNRER